MQLASYRAPFVTVRRLSPNEIGPMAREGLTVRDDMANGEEKLWGFPFVSSFSPLTHLSVVGGHTRACLEKIDWQNIGRKSAFPSAKVTRPDRFS